MNCKVLLIGGFFAVLSSLVLAYVVLVTSMGPWIAPTLVLIGGFLLRIFSFSAPSTSLLRMQELALIQSIGSVGGVVGTAIAFSFPMFYFLDQSAFNGWLKEPLYFCSLLGTVCFCAGGLGIYLASLFAPKFIRSEKFSFPVSTLIYNMITSQAEGVHNRQTLYGLGITTFFCMLRDGLFSFRGIFPKTIFIAPRIFYSEFAIALYTGPTLWAIGFIAGSLITFPLIIGIISKYLVLYPLNYHAHYLPFSLFKPMSTELFSMAFCSGLVLIEACMSVLGYPQMIWATLKEYISGDTVRKFLIGRLSSGFVPTPEQVSRPDSRLFFNSFFRGRLLKYIEGVFVITISCALFTYLEFPLIAQCIMLFFILIATYQMSYLSVKVGLLPFGRFTLFVMVPMMLLFKLDYIQLTMICVFVGICGGVASDLLFDYKVGELCNVSSQKIHKSQWIGLIITSLVMGFFLWLLFTSFQIGSPELFAKRGRMRALLIQATHFNMWVLMLGALYGLLLSRLKVNPALTLGGILMPNTISLGLIIGALCSKLIKKQEEYTPFWSGVFAGESLWILVYMITKWIGL